MPLVLVPMMALLSACAGQDTTRTGFISSYDGMQSIKDHSYDLIYVDPTYVAAKYQKIIIDPVEWVPATDTPKRDPKVIEQLRADFHKSLTEALAKDYMVVDAAAAGAAPATGVLRLRSAITNTRRANWWINAPVQVAGIAGIFLGIPGVPPPDPGGASEELEVVDVQTGKRVAAIATYNNGKPWNPVGYFEEFGHARLAFTKAAELLRDELHPKSS